MGTPEDVAAEKYFAPPTLGVVGMSCQGCIWFYEEKDVNWRECTHPDYDQEEDVCPGRYDKENARYSGYDKY